MNEANGHASVAVDLEQRAPEILGRYPEKRGRSALLPLLHLAQQRDGYLTSEGIADVARILELTPAEVTAVATFYTMLHLRPTGRRIVSVCHNIACTLAGAEEVISALQTRLGIECGQTTFDGAVTLERAECLARCDLAPMMQIDYDEMIGPVTPTRAIEIVEAMGASMGSRPELRLDVSARQLGTAPDRLPRSSSPSQARPGPIDAPIPPGDLIGQGSTRGSEQEELEEPLLVESIELSEEDEGLLHREEGDDRG